MISWIDLRVCLIGSRSALRPKDNCNFLCRSTCAHTLAEIHNCILTHMTWFADNGLTSESWLMEVIALHLLKFATPVAPVEQAAGQADVAALYANKLCLTAYSKAKRQLSALRMPMGTSLVYKKAFEKKRKRAAEQDGLPFDLSQPA